jgi:protein ImuB
VLSRMTDGLLERVRSKARAIAKHYERIVRPALLLRDKPTLLKLLQLDLESHP